MLAVLSDLPNQISPELSLSRGLGKPFSGQRHVLNLCGAAWKPRSGEAQKSWKILVTRKEL